MGIVAMLVALGMIGGSLAEKVKAKEPFAFTQNEVVRASHVDVLFVEARHRDAAARVSAVLEADLVELQRYLGWSRMPKVHVALRPTLDTRSIEGVALDDQDGILLYANFIAEGFELDGLRARALERVLLRGTRAHADPEIPGRAAFEPNVWVSRALVHAWPPSSAEPSPRTLGRALWLGRHRTPSWQSLERARLVEERFGHDAFSAWAATAGLALRAQAGPERTQRFVRAILDPDPPWGLAAVFASRTEPVGATLERETGVSADRLVQAWQASLRSSRSDRLAVPRLAPSLAIEAPEPAVRNVRWRLRFDPAPEPGSRCTLVHAALGAFDAPVADADLVREERECSELSPEGELLLGRYSAGERVLLAIEVSSPSLGATLRVHAERRLIE